MKLVTQVFALMGFLLMSCANKELAPAPSTSPQASAPMSGFRHPAGGDTQFDCSCEEKKTVCGGFERMLVSKMKPTSFNIAIGDEEFEVGENISYVISNNQMIAPAKTKFFDPITENMRGFIGKTPRLLVAEGLFQMKDSNVQVFLRDEGNRSIKFRCRKW